MFFNGKRPEWTERDERRIAKSHPALRVKRHSNIRCIKPEPELVGRDGLDAQAAGCWDVIEYSKQDKEHAEIEGENTERPPHVEVGVISRLVAGFQEDGPCQEWGEEANLFQSRMDA
jgi:hypothetical protein